MSAQLNPLQEAETQRWQGAAPTDHARDEARARVLDSTQILAGQREIIIEHQGTVYRLRHTKNGKLIPTK